MGYRENPGRGNIYPSLQRHAAVKARMPSTARGDMVFCCRLAEECRELEYVSLHCTADMGQAVVTALNTADLGWDEDAHRLRTIRLYVPRG